MATLKDIAKEAGVSLMTVSNVVNGNLQKVSKENAERIREIIRKQGYVPNSSARSLAKSTSNIIAVLLHGGQNENSLNNPHNSTLVGGIIQRVQALGYYTMVSLVQSQEEIVQHLLTWNVEGAILLGMFDAEIEQIYNTNHVPMVFVDSYSKVRQLSNVGIDDYRGGRLAAQYLIDNGHRNIAFISPPPSDDGVIQHRLDGFLSVLSENHLSLDPRHQYVLKSDVDPLAIITIGKALAGQKGLVTAAFITSDQIASYVIQGLQSSGVKIPDDFSLIGFDNIMLSTQITPQLTTIAQNLEQKAAMAVEILINRIKAPGIAAESRILDVELVIRDTVSRIGK